MDLIIQKWFTELKGVEDNDQYRVDTIRDEGLCSSPLFLTIQMLLEEKVVWDWEILQTALGQTKRMVLFRKEREISKKSMSVMYRWVLMMYKSTGVHCLEREDNTSNFINYPCEHTRGMFRCRGGAHGPLRYVSSTILNYVHVIIKPWPIDQCN